MLVQQLAIYWWSDQGPNPLLVGKGKLGLGEKAYPMDKALIAKPIAAPY